MITGGSIAYNPAGTAPFAFNTVATYTCLDGFAMVGESERTCESADPVTVGGVWSGVAPSCECEAI